MADEGFSFLHASNLRLDEPITGVGPITGEGRRIAADATLQAWERIVETCLAQEVDFLLLTGNIFDHRTFSLRGRLALQRGLEKLDSFRVEVFVVPGHLDPASSWTRSVNFPPSVMLIKNEDSEPVAIVRDGRVLAALHVIASAETDESQWNDNIPSVLQSPASSYRIGVAPAGVPVKWDQGQAQPLPLPGVSPTSASLINSAIENGVNFIACGGGIRRSIRSHNSLIHDPGPPQSISPHVTGQCGCSLVRTDSSGATAIEFIPTAPVRWEEIFIKIDSTWDMDLLVEQMVLEVMELASDDSQDICILNWTVQCQPGELFEALSQDPNCQELQTQIEEQLAGETESNRIHRFDLQLKHGHVERFETESELFRAYEELLEQKHRELIDASRRELLREPWLQRADLHLIVEFLKQTDSDQLREQMNELATNLREEHQIRGKYGNAFL